MEQDQFEKLAKRLETYARAHPRTYKLRVGLLAGLGYAYLILVLVALLVVTGVLAFALRSGGYWLVKLAIPLVALMGAVLRAMWVKMPAPEGVPLECTDAPQLFQTLEEIRSQLRAPRSDTVLLCNDFNAGVMLRPRLGIFGWPKRYLTLGYPLMQALTPEQFRAVIAHEFGHISGNHGRFAGWIYRIRQTWSQLLENLQQSRRWGSEIFIRFSEWYAPLFNAYTFVMARAHEYEADQTAAEVTSKRMMAEALIAMELRARFLMESVWPAVWKQTVDQPEPPADAVTVAGRAVTQPLPGERAPQWLSEGLNRATTYIDTHPALTDRLAALGFASASGDQGASRWEVGLTEALPETAATKFLGVNADRLAGALNAQWKKDVMPQWHDEFDRLQETRQTLTALEEKAAAGPLSGEESWTHAWSTLELKGVEAALPLVHKILAANPDHVSANFWLGRTLLGQGDAAGVDYLERAMAHDPFIVAPGCHLLSAFYAERGQTADAQTCLQRAVEQQKILAVADRERPRVDYSDTFEPHALAPADLASVTRILSWYPAVERAYLVRKKVQSLPQQPLFVLGVLRRRSWIESGSLRKSQELAGMIAKRVVLPPGTGKIMVFSSRNEWTRALERIPGSEIYVGSG